MMNSYKKLLVLLAFLTSGLLGATAAQAASTVHHRDGYSVWMTSSALGPGMTAEQRAWIINQGESYWNANEPNNASSGEHCAVQQKAGGWNDLPCNNNTSRKAACFNGVTWALSSTNQTSRATAITQCPTGYVFAAPTNQAQRTALSAVIPSDGDAWINAADNNGDGFSGTEGVWRYNLNTSTVIMPKWLGGTVAADANKNCASLSNNGDWEAQNCADVRPALCANQELTSFALTGQATAFTSVKELSNLCKQQYGQRWNFVAPNYIQQNNSARALVSGTPAWINATDDVHEGYWLLNQYVTNWASGEPSFGTNHEKQCVVARQDGAWEMADCDSRAYILCSDGATWEARKHTHQFSNQAYEACSRPETANTEANPYRNHQLKTPVTEADRQRAGITLQTVGAGNKAWLNMKYIRDTQQWYINESYSTLEFAAGNSKVQVWYNVFKDGSNKDTVPTVVDYYGSSSTLNLPLAQALQHNQGIPTYFAHQEPNGSKDNLKACTGWLCSNAKYKGETDRFSCIQLAAQDFSWAKKGQWDDTSCNNSKYVACSDGFEWRTSLSPVNMGADVDSSENITAAHNACKLIEKDGVVGNFRFAAPASFAESQRLLNVAASEGRDTVWINMHSKKYWRAFVINQGAHFQAPFWNSGEPNNAGGEDCAVQQSTAGWNDIPCGAPYVYPIACYDPFDGANGKWQVTSTSHAYLDSTNAEKSIEDFNLKCQAAFGGRYKFFAPITQSHQTDLKAAMVTAGATNAHINANDIAVENSWNFNTHINNWENSQPNGVLADDERCVSANATTSWWQSRECDDELPVACSSGARWYFTEAKVKLSEFANGERACYNEFGPGYSFAAPRTLDSALQLQYFAKLEGVGADFWINGNRLEDFNRWTWNAKRLSTPVWGYGNQPDGGTAENCAVINNNSEGAWDDERCGGQVFAYLCRNGDNWAVTTQTGTLDDFSVATKACATDLGAGWVFAAPTTYNENLAAKNAMGLNNKVWVNATDAVTEGTWLLNAAPITDYPAWGDTSTGNCLYQDDKGEVSSVECVGAQEYSWACNDGYTWKVTKSVGRIQKFADGHKACLSEYGVNFMFAAPLNVNDTMQLDFARLQAANDRNSPVSKVWINMTTKAVSPLIGTGGRKFRRNLPFNNWRDHYAGEEPLPTLCAYKNTSAAGTDNPWLTASCSNFAAHYACTDGDTWRVALSKGRLVGNDVQLVPQVGEDYWSYERGNAMCKDQFGSSFYFSAPISAAEELALDAAIRRSPANVKNVWLNYFAVSAIAGKFLSQYASGSIQRGDGLWFANRLKLGTWKKPNFNNYNNANCALLHVDGSYTDASCSNNSRLDGNDQTYSYACFNGVEWSLPGTEGYWIDGFNACEQSNNSMFAVPRTPDELDDLTDVMDTAGKTSVWINLNDTAQEGQWIANRLQFSWWAPEEPRNDFNKDCAKISKGSSKYAAGEWYAARCSIELAAFACRTTTTGSSGDTIRWDVTETTGEWSEGFGACAKEFPGSQFIAPQGFGITSASEDQDLLKSVVQNPTVGSARDAWINLSDQEFEGAWRGHQAYSHWGTNSLFDQTQDCGYIDVAVPVETGKGNWFADSCKYTTGTAVSRGYSCTDGGTWKVVGANATTDMRWSSGFEACQTLLGSDWYFSAPTNDLQNRQLEVAMKLAGVGQVWINAHDRLEEGNWLINGLEVNFPPEINVSATATVVNDQTTDIVLHAILTDEEETGIDPAQTTWTLVSNREAFAEESDPDKTDITVTDLQIVHDTHGAGSATLTAKYSTPTLFKEDRLLTFKVKATDNGSGSRGPATAEVFVNVRVMAPLVAAYDFESNSRPNRDITGHGYDILTSTMSSAQVITEVTNGKANRAIKLAPTSQLVVPGIASDPVNGLDFSANEYTIALRISIEAANTGKWRGIVQKGDGGLDRQPGLFLFDNSDALHSTNSTTEASNRAANSANPLLDKQWLNLIYVKTANNFKVYVDGVQTTNYDFVGGETSLYNTGNFYIGDIPGAEESFTGLIDDIHIFNREIPVAQFGDILPPLPMGNVGFVESSAVVDEFDESNPNHSYNISVERTRGNAAPLTVYVNHNSGSATRGNLADMTNATDAADFAFTNEANFTAGKGVAVTWAAGERGSKSVALTLDIADDEIREGTETALFGFGQVGEPADTRVGLAGNTNFTLYINDLTPNEYGNISVGIKQGATLVSELAVLETNSAAQEICFVRDIGSYAGFATGDLTIYFTLSGNAVDKADDPVNYHYEMSGSPFPANGQIEYADGESGQRCFNVVPQTNSIVSDHNLKVSISHIDSSDPIVVAGAIVSDDMQTANLIIQDFTPGVLGFDAASYHCYEEINDTNNAKVPSWAQRPAGSVCAVVVKRTGTGTNAPAAQLTLTVGANNYGLAPTYLLDWPAINTANPINPANETKALELPIPHADIQNGDVEIALALTANSGEAIEAGKGSATLYVQDVTTPAIISTPNQPAVNEGAQATFVAARSGNSSVYFDMHYEVDVVSSSGNPLPNPPEYYIDTHGAPLSNTVLWPANESELTYPFTAKNTDANVKVLLNLTALGRPASDVRPALFTQRDDIVGMGDASAVGSGSANTMQTEIAVNNTLDTIASNMTVIVKDLGTDSNTRPSVSFAPATGEAVNAGNFLAVNKVQVPTTRELELEIKLPAGKQINAATYTWTLLSPNGLVATWDDGVTPIASTNGNSRFVAASGGYANRTGSLNYNSASELSVKTKVKLPFVVGELNVTDADASKGVTVGNTPFTLKLEIVGNSENTVVKEIDLTVQPVYRRLNSVANTDKCLRAMASSGAGAPDCGDEGDWADLYWAWNPENQQLVNQKAIATNNAKKCFDSGGVSAVDVNTYWSTCSASTVFPFETSGNTNLRPRPQGDRICKYTGNNITRRSGNTCTGNDEYWKWLD